MKSKMKTSIKDWVIEHLEQGYSSQELKDILDRRGYEPKVVDVILAEEKSQS